MGNGRNNVDPSVMSMMPMPFDASGMPIPPIDAPRPGPVPISTLTSALASANQADRTRVCYTFHLAALPNGAHN